MYYSLARPFTKTFSFLCGLNSLLLLCFYFYHALAFLENLECMQLRHYIRSLCDLKVLYKILMHWRGNPRYTLKIFCKDSSIDSIAKTSSVGLILSIVSIIHYRHNYNFSANIEDLYNGQRSYSPTKTLWYVITILRTYF